MDEDLKKQAEKLFADLGMNMTTAINVFIRQSINYGGIPFEIKLDGFYNPYNQKLLRESIKQLDEGKGKVHDLMEDNDDKNMV
jgi:DNA-damage-inducible protein J